jgi:polysaccharide biosynthesis protein PslH
MSDRLRCLFYKREIAWPFRSGHDVHTFNMMNALSAAGHHLGLITALPLAPPVQEALHCEFHHTLGPDTAADDAGFDLPMPQERFRRFWGITSSHLRTVRQVSDQFRPDAFVVSGLEVLPVLTAVRGAVRIWYAADEWVLHHLSQVHLLDTRSWANVRDAAIKGMYERAFRSVTDRVWAVTHRDAWAFKRIAGIDGVDLIPNGVDAAWYTPSTAIEEPFTAVFWGRLDFGPNIQGLEWFCSQVWPLVIERYPHARFTIIGFQPGAEVQRLATLPGVRLSADVPDVRGPVHSHAVVVLPFTSGAGIKNKLLEAAAMGKAIVCTPTALGGLSGNPPFTGLQKPQDWVQALGQLWQDDDERRRRGRAARDWVVEHHTWSAAALKAQHGIAASLARTRQR